MVDDHFFAAQGTVGFGPFQFAWLSLHFEVLVAFRAAEAEDLGVVADEGDAFGWVYGSRAKMAGFDPKYILTGQNAATKTNTIPHCANSSVCVREIEPVGFKTTRRLALAQFVHTSCPM